MKRWLVIVVCCFFETVGLAASNTVLSVDALLDRFVFSRPSEVDSTVARDEAVSGGGVARSSFSRAVVDEVLSEFISVRIDDLDWYLDQGHQFLFERKYLDAMLSYAHVLRRDPQHVKAMEGLGLSFARLDNDRAAYTLFDALLERFPDVGRYSIQLATLHYRMGAYKKAWALLRSVDASEFVFERAYLGGLLSYAQGEHAQAVRLLHRAIQGQPDQAVPLQALAEIYASIGEPEAALRVLEHLKGRVDPDAYAAFIALPVFYELRR